MKSEESKKDKKLYHDFMLEKEWLVNIMGFGQSRSLLYIAYIALIFGYFLYHIVMTGYGMVLAFQEKTLFVDGLHMIMISVFTLWGLTTRLLTGRALKKIRAHINSGFYSYDDEELSEEQQSMKESVVGEIRAKSRDFVAVWFVGGLTIGLFYPLSQVFVVTPDAYEREVDLSNPYLPAFFYMPFGTRSWTGFCVAFCMALVYFFYAVGATIIMNEIYMSCVMQLRVQLRILNLSIRNMHRRAILLYQKTSDIPHKEMSLDDVCTHPEYQGCLYKCLRANVAHHQILLRFNEEVLKFSGSFLLLMFNVASMAFAANFFLIMQNPSLNISIKCLVTLVAEQTYTLYLCIFGEIIMEESGSLFESLYSVPWFHYNKTFNQTLRVFMCYTMKPMRVKSLLLDLTASLETYANFMSTMYKIVNILKQSDTI